MVRPLGLPDLLRGLVASLEAVGAGDLLTALSLGLGLVGLV